MGWLSQYALWPDIRFLRSGSAFSRTSGLWYALHHLLQLDLLVSCPLAPRPLASQPLRRLHLPDRPVHLLGFILASIGCSLLAVSRYLSTASTESYSALPLDDLNADDPLPSRSPTSPTIGHVHLPPSIRRLRLAFLLLVLAICARVDTVRRLVQNIQCVGPSYTELMPLAFAILDFWTYQRHSSLPRDTTNLSIYELFEEYWATSRFRYLFPTAILALSSAAIMHNSASPSSTYICPISIHKTQLTTQHLGFVLDFCIAYCTEYLLQAYSSSAKSSPVKSISVIAWACLLSSCAMFISGIVWSIAVPEDRAWLLSVPKGFIWSSIKLAILCCIMALSACVTIFYSGVMSVTAVATFVATCSVAFRWSWRTLQPFPPAADTSTFLLFCCVLFGFATFLNTQAISDDHRRHGRAIFAEMPIWIYVIIVFLFLGRGVIWLAHHADVAYHPIDLLIHEANVLHDAYAARAHSSTNLTTAVTEYQNRYQRQPPPGFDRWYEYAMSRNSSIIDEFDKINQDLLPFWTLPPAEIRQRTWQLISNPWNDVAGISIRNGKAEISPNVMPTHRWMLDGIIGMMDHFSEWLPDMDLGFNLNDESRISVPYEDLQARRKFLKSGGLSEKKFRNSFSDKRADTWKPVPEEAINETPFKEMSFQRTFDEFGRAGCPPSSPARKTHHWDTSHLCTTCVAPHSLGAFLSDWAKSGNICHQPDMANLHGFYLSPAAFKASHELFPVFSQSKAYGYNDILYPSAWNYMDKVKYDPSKEHPDLPFEEKTKTLFWRGSTSEGVSPGSGTWKGMSRQRFVHLANNIHNTSPPQPILLPFPFSSQRKKLSYRSVATSELVKHLTVDMHVVEMIARCGGPDCPAQETEFAPLVPPTDFQSHWSYRYLLDLDGAAFSGRFLPFLHSRSLPFKAALFREWWDSRLTPWLHFVPLDLRGHGFWATLVYFMGFEGMIKGNRVILSGHEKMAQLIAGEGREWAGKVLRKEDMEIYMFRLLIEWGRLTDDFRDEIGFSGD